jgi:HECT-domain (ubiquitin-transferase)
VSAQFDAFASGFHRVMGGASLRILRAEELELLVAGSQVLLVRAAYALRAVSSSHVIVTQCTSLFDNTVLYG